MNPAADLDDLITGPDGYQYFPDDPRFQAHQLLDGYLREATSEQRADSPLKEHPAGQAILNADKQDQVGLLHAALDRLHWFIREGKGPANEDEIVFIREGEGWRETRYTDRGELAQEAYGALFQAVTARVLPLTAEDLLHFLEVLVPNLEAWNEWQANSQGGWGALHRRRGQR